MGGNSLKRVFSLLFGVLLLALLPLNVLADSNPVPRAKKAVACIASGIYYKNGEAYTYDGYYGMGTGFGVGNSGDDAKVFVTNNHVVSDNSGKPYDEVYVLIDNADLGDESTVVPCKVLYTDADIDLAIIQAKDPIPGVRTLPLRPAEEIPTGDTVYALGFPGIADVAADANHYTVEDITVTNGIISRRLQSGGVDCMAHTAAINHGNSGGPLIDADGNVVGINTFGFTDKETADMRGYAIYIDYAMEALDELGLPYTTEAEKKEFPVTAAAIGVGIVVLIGAAAVMLLRKKKHVPLPAPAPQPVPPQRILLQCTRGPLQGNSWELFVSLSIGRNPGENIVLPADTPGISRKHCLISRQGNQVTVTDLGSSYGTSLNANRLTPNQPVQAFNGASISLANGGVQFQILFL